MRRVYPPAVYKRVAQTIREHIEAGLYRPGEKLPTVIELTTLYEIKPGSAYAALRLLHQEGHVTSQRGRMGGYFVAPTRTSSGRKG